MIRVGTFDYKTGACPFEPDFVPVVVHPGKRYPYGALDPYHVKTKEGYFIENAYQFRKIYRNVKAQDQWSYCEGYQGKVNTWSHPAEVHMCMNEDKFYVTPEYWNWRKKGLENRFAIRYPAGYAHKREVLGLLTDDNQLLDYCNGRKVYVSAYLESNVKQHPLYQDLETRLSQGQNLMLCEVDGPQYHDSAPYNLLPVSDKSKWSLLVTPEILKQARWNPNRPFGHGYVLAAMLAHLETVI